MSWSFHIDRVENYAFWNDAFSPLECQKIVEQAKLLELETATVDTDNQQRTDIRKSNVVFIQPLQFKWVFERITDISLRLNKDYFNFDLWGLMENLQFTEYNAPGGKYNEHIDKMFDGSVRKLSIVVQLTDPSEYEGGELQLLYRGDRDPEIANKKQGHMIAFPSYTMHRVTPVTKGTRHSLVGWITGKPFT